MYLKRVIYAALILGLFGCSTTKEVKEPPSIKIPPPPKEEQRVAKPLPPPEPFLPLKRPQGYGNMEALVSVNVKDAGLKKLLLTMAEQAGVNLVIDEDIEDKRVSVTLKKVPFWQALKAVLGAHGLYSKPYPGYLRISRMVTRFFHIDYVVSTRGGTSSTSVVLVSGGTEGAGATSSNVTSSEEVNFWESFEERLKSLLQDPLYEILQAEYERKKLQKDLALLPYKEQYEKELQRHRMKMFSLKSKMLERQLQMGFPPEAAPEMRVEEETPTEAVREEAREVTREEEERLLGSYTIDPQTGTVVVTTTPEMMERVEKFIASVKEELKRQVLIDVQILEVSLDKERKLGIDWSSFPGTIQFFKMPDLREAIERSMATAGAAGGGAAGAGGIVSPLATPPFSFSPTGGLQAGVLHILGDDVAYQHTIDTLISFLKEQGEVRAIARPQLVTLNNQPAIVSVGINDFYVTYELTTTAAAAGGVATTAVTSKLNPIFIGVTLNITPQISPNGEIILKIVPAINRKVDEKTVPTGIPSAPTQVIPIIETRQTSTVVRVKSGQIVIISGLIQEREGGVTRKVVGLGDIPGIGEIFTHRTRERERSELVIIVTPRLRYPFTPGKGLGYDRISRGKEICTGTFTA